MNRQQILERLVTLLDNAITDGGAFQHSDPATYSHVSPPLVCTVCGGSDTHSSTCVVAASA